MDRQELRPIARHLDVVLEGLRPADVVATSIYDALGLATAEAVVSGLDLPPFANSAMDGYAVRAADVQSLPKVLPVAADLAAGSSSANPLSPGTTHRIMTGAAIPADANAVIPVEWTDGGTTQVQINSAPQPVAPGLNIRPMGDDLTVGTALCAVGDSIDASLLGLLVSAGVSTLQVFPRPRVAVVSTGDELNAVGSQLPPGGIYDSNGPMMAALVTEAGGLVVDRVHIADDVAVASQVLKRLAEDVDLIVTMGGVSAGAYEVVKDVFAVEGHADFAGVAMQPGKPQGVGNIGGTRVLALPGNPLSSLVSFHVFVRPALRRLGGHSAVMPLRARLATRSDLMPRRDRTRYLPAVADLLERTVETAGRHGSHRSSIAVGTNCLIEVPQGDRSLPAGSTVEVVMLRD